MEARPSRLFWLGIGLASGAALSVLVSRRRVTKKTEPEGYVIVQIDVNPTESDSKAFAEYKQRVGPIISSFGGSYCVRGGNQTMLEGEQVSSRTVVLKFSSVAKAREWYDSNEYSEVKKLRTRASIGRVTLVEGVA